MNLHNQDFDKGRDLVQELITKAWESTEFKEQLISNPRETIAEVTGRNVSDMANTRRIVVEDQSDENIIYFNIPAQVDLDEVELTDEQLEKVSGGDFGATLGIVAGVVALCYLANDIYNGWNQYGEENP